MARSFAYLFGFGGGLLLVTVALPGPSDRDSLALAAIAAAAFLLCIISVTAWRHIPGWLFVGMLLIATVLTSGCCWFGGAELAGSYGLAYVWSVLIAFYFFGRSVATVNALLASAAFGAVLVAKRGIEFGPLRWVALTGAIAASGFLVAWLRRHAEGSAEELAAAARTDPLTGLMNRREFDIRLGEQIAMAKRGRPFALVSIDVDGLKPINDREGHKAGDDVLRDVAANLRIQAREGDVVARVGGDEFAAVIGSADQAEAFLVAERFREAVRRAFAAEPRHVTLSLGVAVYGVHGFKARELLDAADLALYAAKHRGGDRTMISEAEVLAGLSATSRDEALGAQPSNLETAVSLARAVEIRQNGSDDHSQAVARNAEILGQWLRLDPARIDRLRLAGLLHDIGTVSIPRAILSKAGRLTDAEAALISRHAEVGAEIVRNARLDDIAEWIWAHHERPDGRGYPRGLRGDEIPIEARILAVADANEAMVGARAYRPALSQFAASEELRRGAGTQFDARVVRIFLSLVANRTPSSAQPA